MSHCLILSGGIFHDFDATSEARATMLARQGLTSQIEDNIEAERVISELDNHA